MRKITRGVKKSRQKGMDVNIIAYADKATERFEEEIPKID